MKKQLVIFVVALILAITCLYAYLNNPDFQTFVASMTEEEFSDENIYSDIESLSMRLDEEIMKGSQDFTVYLKDMDTDAIDEINSALDGVFGSGSTYQQIGTVGNTYKKVNITIKRTTNYYALKAYTEGEAIPSTERKAQRLYQAVHSVMKNCIKEGMSDFEKEVALHDYLVRHCKYSKNVTQTADSDIFRAYGALVNGDAVCNGYAEALQLLFACAGIESKFVIGTADGIDHAWNLVKLDDKWYHLDATWNDPVPDKKDVAIHSFFNVPDEIMKQSHTWNQENYPESYSMDYNYYKYNNLYFRDFNEYKLSAYDAMISGKQSRFEGAMRQYTEGENDMQFIFQDNDLYESINWQSFCGGKYHVLIIEAE